MSWILVLTCLNFTRISGPATFRVSCRLVAGRGLQPRPKCLLSGIGMDCVHLHGLWIRKDYSATPGANPFLSLIRVDDAYPPSTRINDKKKLLCNSGRNPFLSLIRVDDA